MPYIQAPYAPTERYQRNSRLLDLMAQQGQQAAQATAARGERLGNLVAGIGQTLGKGISDVQEYRREEPERQLKLRDLQLRQVDQTQKIRAAERTQQGQEVMAQALRQFTDPEDVARAVAQAGHPDLAQAFLKNQVDLADAMQTLASGKIKTAKEFNQLEAQFIAPILQAPPEEQQPRWTAARESLKALGLDLSGVPDAFDPVAAKAHVEAWAPTERGAPGSVATRFGIPVPGSQVPVTPPRTDPSLQQKDVTLDGKPHQLVNFNPRTGEMTLPGSSEPIAPTRVQGNPAAAQAGAGADTQDAAAIADAIIRGEQPPVTTGLFRLAGPVRAALAKQGYDLATANLDWQATQRHILTLNSNQQLRLNQAINALPDLLDTVDALAEQWKGRFPLLNKANLILAKGGAFGTAAATIANQLDTQIADVVGDLGTVYMGGNSPTDNALKLAQTSLKGEWSEPVLRSMVTLAKKNVGIRRNSVNTTGVAGASADNPYMRPPPSSESAPPPPATTSAIPSYEDYQKAQGK